MNLDRMLANSIKRRTEAYNGRIHTTPGNWVFEPTQAQIKRTKEANPCLPIERVDADGRPMFLISQKGTHCTDEEKCAGIYPRNKDRPVWFIPYHVCRKCEHHRKGNRRGKVRYPCCMLRKQDNPERRAVEDVGNAVRQARTDVDEMFRR